MTRADSDLDRFSRLIEALRPWLGQIIVIGGRAHELFRLRPEARSVTYPPLRTDDADVALNPRSLKTSTNIRERLATFGFSEEFSGDDQPPVTHYGLGDGDDGFYAEFLTPLVGGERRRDGSPNITERVGGIVAQKLRYLDVLLLDPWTVTLARDGGLDLTEPATIQIPNPASYLVQKLLIHDRRKAADKAKDVLYMHDTIELFAGSLGALHETWNASVAPTLGRAATNVARSQADALFSSVNDTVREAALIAAPRLSPGGLQEACKAGFERLLGPA
jgi:hypothetical protein